MFQYLFLNMTYKLVFFSLEDTVCSFYGVPVQNVIKNIFPLISIGSIICCEY